MSQPLSGKRILVTRAMEQAKEFSEKLKEAGAIPVVVPLLHVRPTYSDENRQLLEKLHTFTWIFFTSTNGVKYFFEQLSYYGFDKDALKPLKIAVVGDKTEFMLNHYGCAADLKPSDFKAEALIGEYFTQNRSSERILLACGNRARQEIPQALQQNGIFFERLITYETLTNSEQANLLEQYITSGNIDVLTFTSPSTVEALHSLVSQSLFKQVAEQHVCVCIGSTTETRAFELGIKQVLVPDTFTIEGMIEVLMDHYKTKGSGEK